LSLEKVFEALKPRSIYSFARETHHAGGIRAATRDPCALLWCAVREARAIMVQDRTVNQGKTH